MPYSLTWEPHGVVKKLWGFVTGREFFRSSELIVSDPRFVHVRYIVNDFSEMRGHSISEADLEDTAAVRAQAMGADQDLWVLIVSTDPDVPAFVKAMERPALIGAREIRAFATMSAARAWLTAELPLLENDSRH